MVVVATLPPDWVSVIVDGLEINPEPLVSEIWNPTGGVITISWVKKLPATV